MLIINKKIYILISEILVKSDFYNVIVLLILLL
jgi:hypothetical protein